MNETIGRPEVSRAAVSLRNIYKNFKAGSETVSILNGADLDIDEGKTYAVTGESGTGKSTLLHIIGTLLKPDSGSVSYIDAGDVYRMRDRDISRFRNRNIGFVFQFHYLLNEFDCLENAAMPLYINKTPKTEALKVAREYLCAMGLEKRLSFKPYMLSGGEQQRAAIARALVCSPKVLLMDEPTGNLDPRHASGLHELIMKLNRDFGKTLIVVTHDSEFSGMMDRKIKIAGGLVEYIN